MAYDYGYGELENQLIEAFNAGAPDFELANSLLEAGADLNAEGTDTDENMLAEILLGYHFTEGECIKKEGEECEQNECHGCSKFEIHNPNLGGSMIKIIRFFLDKGFDLNRNDGRVGAQCLSDLRLSSNDAYMIEATKILFDAGAKNIPPYLDDDETPKVTIACEQSYEDTCNHNHHLGNIFEAIYQVYQAQEDGRDYHGIDSYEKSIGKKISKVYAKAPGNGELFYDLNLPTSNHKNCYNTTLYFEYEDGVLITTEFADFWTDTILPDNLMDVSMHFRTLIGSRINRFTFSHREIVKGTTHYGQPVTKIEMDNGSSITFSINFGEVEKEDRAAYFTID